MPKRPTVIVNLKAGDGAKKPKVEPSADDQSDSMVIDFQATEHCYTSISKDAPMDSTGLSQSGPSTSVRRQSVIVSPKPKMKAEASVTSQLNTASVAAISPLARTSPGFDESLAMPPVSGPKFWQSYAPLRSVSTNHEKRSARVSSSRNHLTQQSRTPRLICDDGNCQFRAYNFQVMQVHTMSEHSAKLIAKGE